MIPQVLFLLIQGVLVITCLYYLTECMELELYLVIMSLLFVLQPVFRLLVQVDEEPSPLILTCYFLTGVIETITALMISITYLTEQNDCGEINWFLIILLTFNTVDIIFLIS